MLLQAPEAAQEEKEEGQKEAEQIEKMEEVAAPEAKQEPEAPSAAAAEVRPGLGRAWCLQQPFGGPSCWVGGQYGCLQARPLQERHWVDVACTERVRTSRPHRPPGLRTLLCISERLAVPGACGAQGGEAPEEAAKGEEEKEEAKEEAKEAPRTNRRKRKTAPVVEQGGCGGRGRGGWLPGRGWRCGVGKRGASAQECEGGRGGARRAV